MKTLFTVLLTFSVVASSVGDDCTRANRDDCTSPGYYRACEHQEECDSMSSCAKYYRCVYFQEDMALHRCNYSCQDGQVFNPKYDGMDMSQPDVCISPCELDDTDTCYCMEGK